MRLSLKTRQVAGVTLIVGLSVTALGMLFVATVLRIRFQEDEARAGLLWRTLVQQASKVPIPADPVAALRADTGVRSILESAAAYSKNVTYLTIVDANGVAVVHSSEVLEGQRVPDEALLSQLVAAGPIEQLKAVFSERTFEVREPLLFGENETWTVRVGLSMVLMRDDLKKFAPPVLAVVAGAMAGAVFVALIFSQWLLRPIHILRAGLSRLGKGEQGVTLDLPPGDEFAGIGESFKTLSEALAASRERAADPVSTDTVVDRLEDAVAILAPSGDIMFANGAMRRILTRLPLDDDPSWRKAMDEALASRGSSSTQTLRVDEGGETREYATTAHALGERNGQPMGAMLVARDVTSRTQVASTLKYSRKIASLSKLLAGVAHEVKNPLNAMTIHLELLKQKLGGVSAVGVTGPVDAPGALRHVGVIADEIRRLDSVVQGFLRFSRPEELSLTQVDPRTMCDDVARIVDEEARTQHVRLANEVGDLPPIAVDAVMMKQALLNLVLNALQAMPTGGVLRFSGRILGGDRVAISVSDTGVGISPDALPRIFDLYFTTKEGGSGIGLSMVYRAIHLHDGSVEVESTPGHGTTFRLVLPAAM